MKPENLKFFDKPSDRTYQDRRVIIGSATSPGMLGEIRWHTGWKQFVFVPQPGCTLNRQCLDRIAWAMTRMEDEAPLDGVTRP